VIIVYPVDEMTMTVDQLPLESPEIAYEESAHSPKASKLPIGELRGLGAIQVGRGRVEESEPFGKVIQTDASLLCILQQ
jgi:hypothetical protein